MKDATKVIGGHAKASNLPAGREQTSLGVGRGLETARTQQQEIYQMFRNRYTHTWQKRWPSPKYATLVDWHPNVPIKPTQQLYLASSAPGRSSGQYILRDHTDHISATGTRLEYTVVLASWS